MGTDKQSNGKSKWRDEWEQVRKNSQSLVKRVLQYKLGFGWIVLITALSVGLSVPLHRHFIEQNISNDIYEKVKQDAKSEVENILKDPNIAAAIKNQNTGEITKLIKPELHDWVKEEVKDSVSGLTSSTSFVLSFLALLPILYGFAFYLFQNGLIQKAVSDGSKNLKQQMEDNLQEKTQDFTTKLDQHSQDFTTKLDQHSQDFTTKLDQHSQDFTTKLEEYKKETKDIDKQITEKYKLGLTRQIKIILSSIKIERLSSTQKAEISNQDLKDLLRDLKQLLEQLEKDNYALVTKRDYVLLGDAYYANNEYDKAKEAHEKALALKDDNSGVSSSEIHYKIGNDLAGNKQLNDAREEYKKIDKNDPNYIWALHHGGHTYHEEYKYQDAIAKYDDAIKIEKENSNYEALYQTLYYRGNSKAGLHNYEGAKEDYEKALVIEQHFNWLWHSYGDALFKLHYFTEAIEAYNEALKYDYSSLKTRAYTIVKKAEALTCLGKQKKDISKYDEALKQYEYALMFDDNNHDSYWGQGRIYTILACQKENSEQTEEIEKAINFYQRIGGGSSRLLANRAYGLQKLGKQADADYWYRQAQQSLEVQPNKPDKYYEIACYYALHFEFSKNDEDIKQACENLRQAIHGDYNSKSEQDKQSFKQWQELFKKWAEIDLEFDPIRDDPRFIKALQG